ncbi:MAG: zf-HC2 domain-containing protein [Gemmatimonadota bacterium]|nr:MAG: zf-HC2 domain-containing protein [Gemmatimonadota bacterium]
MLTCEQVAQLISESLDRKLPLRKRLAVRTHYLFCKACPQFEKQVRFMRDALRQFQDRVESVESFFATPLSSEIRERMKQALSQAAGDMGSGEM